MKNTKNVTAGAVSKPKQAVPVRSTVRGGGLDTRNHNQSFKSR